MQNNNIDRKKLLEAIGAISKNGNLRQAVAKGDYGSVLSALPPEQAAELSAIMSDKAARDKLLSSPQAQELLRKLGNNGK